ncbi:hypothetical protein Q5P01_013635 [Channa striata]|uniref:Ig-like domain-containing protein n=1 Tax=Channa striata TaxID=64152 RepID=A0AA88SNK1_CHASR|nr:hypothetical protein Q5P01_013635 [Channa striata]
MRDETKQQTETLTSGSVKDFFRYLGINRTLLMCYMFWIFSAAEGNVISKVAGKKVEVPCNVSVSNLTQLEWKRNGINLLSYKPPGNLHINNKEHDNLNTDISTSKGNLYALIIKRAETSHTGNYTCLITTPNGVHEQTWRLIITVPV